jgi:hypothetical protein
LGNTGGSYSRFGNTGGSNLPVVNAGYSRLGKYSKFWRSEKYREINQIL